MRDLACRECQQLTSGDCGKHGLVTMVASHEHGGRLGHWCDWCRTHHSSVSCFHPGRAQLRELEAALLTAQQRIHELEAQLMAQTAGIARLRSAVMLAIINIDCERNHLTPDGNVRKRLILVLDETETEPAGSSPGEPLMIFEHVLIAEPGDDLHVLQERARTESVRLIYHNGHMYEAKFGGLWEETYNVSRRTSPGESPT